MSKTTAGAPRSTSIVRSIVLFTVAQSIVVFLIAQLLSRFLWTEPAAVRAVTVSAWVAVVVQIITFTIARVVARQQVIAGWGLGVLLRFAMVAFWAFLGIRSLDLMAGPALLSLVLFFFVSTLIEPLFLNA